VSVSWRTLALTTGLGYKTIARVVKRLRVEGILRTDYGDREGDQAGAFVLLPPAPSDTTRSTLSTVSLSGVTLRAPLASQKSLGECCCDLRRRRRDLGGADAEWAED
jgi:hypothetical protein